MKGKETGKRRGNVRKKMGKVLEVVGVSKFSFGLRELGFPLLLIQGKHCVQWMKGKEVIFWHQ